MIYSRHRRPDLKKGQPGIKTGELSKQLSLEWKALPEAKRGYYKLAARKVKDAFHSSYPGTPSLGLVLPEQVSLYRQIMSINANLQVQQEQQLSTRRKSALVAPLAPPLPAQEVQVSVAQAAPAVQPICHLHSEQIFPNLRRHCRLLSASLLHFLSLLQTCPTLTERLQTVIAGGRRTSSLITTRLQQNWQLSNLHRTIIRQFGQGSLRLAKTGARKCSLSLLRHLILEGAQGLTRCTPRNTRLRRMVTGRTTLNNLRPSIREAIRARLRTTAVPSISRRSCTPKLVSQCITRRRLSAMARMRRHNTLRCRQTIEARSINSLIDMTATSIRLPTT